jgi:hypothetical protein
VKGNKTPTSHPTMPVPISIAILLALFILGTRSDLRPGHSPRAITQGAKQYNWARQQENKDTLAVSHAQQNDQKVLIKGQGDADSFDNMFRDATLLRFVEDEEISNETTNINNIKSSLQQALSL